MRHPVLMTLFNQTPEQLELSKATLASVLAQDIPVTVFIINNGSTDDGATKRWLDKEVKPTLHGNIKHYVDNLSPLVVINAAIMDIANWNSHGHLLCVPNDVVLPSNIYTEFLKSPRGVITGSMTDDRSFARVTEAKAASENTPLCVVMWRRWVVDAVIDRYGHFFDERFFNYCSDCDLALRLCALGIHGVQLDLQYFHFGSASHRLAPEEAGNAMRAQADVDRSRFIEKWGFGVGDCQYVNSAMDLNFRGEPVG